MEEDGAIILIDYKKLYNRVIKGNREITALC